MCYVQNDFLCDRLFVSAISLPKLQLEIFCGSHRHCVSGDIIVLVFQVILQDHVTKVSSNVMGGICSS